MSRTTAYALVCTGIAVVAVLVASAFAAPQARTGVTVAASVALVVQVLLFHWLQRVWGEGRRFLGAWIGGMLTRLVAVAATAWFVVATGIPPTAPLLALVALLFAMLLLEPVFLRATSNEGAS